MRRFRTSKAHLTLLLGLLAWVVGLGAQQVHEILVQHVRCAEHGQLIELERRASAAADTQHSGPQLQAPSSDEHDHGCSLQATLSSPLPAPLTPALPDTAGWYVKRLIPKTGAPRGPPLRYAPKTSPPAIS